MPRPGDPVTYSRVLWAAVHGVVALAVKLPDFDDASVHRMTELLLDALGRGMRS